MSERFACSLPSMQVADTKLACHTIVQVGPECQTRFCKYAAQPSQLAHNGCPPADAEAHNTPCLPVYDSHGGSINKSIGNLSRELHSGYVG